MQAVELAFEIFGAEHEGCPLLILHGFCASARNWRTIAKQLAVNHRVYVLDMRNHGASPQAEIMDYPSMAQDIQRFLEQHQLNKVHLMGHSMGGKIAMCFAKQSAQQVEKLVVADISPVSYQHSFERTITALKQLPLTEITNRKQAEQWLATDIEDLNYRQFLLQNLAFVDGSYSWRINLDIFQKNAHYIIGFPESAGHATYPKPVLFLAGENSGYINRDAIFKYFPLAEIQEIPGAGHWLHVDAPQLFCHAIEQWLAD